jgi:hypothetical protein
MIINTKKYRPDGIFCSLLQGRGGVFGVLLVALKDFKAGLQQALEFGIAGRRNERRLERAIHRFVIRYSLAI